MIEKMMQTELFCNIASHENSTFFKTLLIVILMEVRFSFLTHRKAPQLALAAARESSFQF
jgi:hypothetical protein